MEEEPPAKRLREAAIAKARKLYPLLADDVRNRPRCAVIGGSGVSITGKAVFSVETPFGYAVNLSFLDEGKQVLFLNRHLCTHIDETTGEVRYAPPHEINYQAMVWALHECKVQKVVALSSAGSLRPEEIPVGSVVMPDDYYMVKPDPITFWPHPAVGGFAAEASKGQVGRIHFTPANLEDEAWTGFRSEVQSMLNSVLTKGSKEVRDQVKLASAQTEASWPTSVASAAGSPSQPCVYVNAVGPRFETRCEIRSYLALGGAVVGMTCAYEWTLCSEIMLPYALISVVDNACNGLSTYPGGALQEYMDHKKQIAVVTASLVEALVQGLTKKD